MVGLYEVWYPPKLLYAIIRFKHAIMRFKTQTWSNHEDCFIRNEIDIQHGTQKPKFDFRLFRFGDLIVKQFFANLRWLHVMTVENFLSHLLIEDWLSFHALIQLYCCKQKQNKIYCNLKDIDMSIALIEKFIILMEDVALPTKIFMGKKANLVKFVWSLNYIFLMFL